MVFFSDLFIALALGASSNALYNENSDVISLTPKNFDKVLQSSEIWIVEFFAPWCGHCQNLVPAYEEAARGLKVSLIFYCKSFFFNIYCLIYLYSVIDIALLVCDFFLSVSLSLVILYFPPFLQNTFCS